MRVQQQSEKQSPRPGESRGDLTDPRARDDREQPVGDASNREPSPADEESVGEDELTEGPLFDPAAEPGKPI